MLKIPVNRIICKYLNNISFIKIYIFYMFFKKYKYIRIIQKNRNLNYILKKYVNKYI
jgi:hypothetical protein